MSLARRIVASGSRCFAFLPLTPDPGTRKKGNLLGTVYLSGTVAAAVLALISFLSAPVFAADAACQPLFDSMTKLFSVPAHSYSTETLPGGKTRTSEGIYINGAIYINLQGKWIRSKMTTQDMLKQEQENIRDSKTSCRHVRDEIVNGEMAALYTVHAETEGINSDAQTWISKSKGVPLHTEEDLDTGDADKRHVSIRYEYSNVRPPAGVQ